MRRGDVSSCSKVRGRGDQRTQLLLSVHGARSGFSGSQGQPSS